MLEREKDQSQGKEEGEKKLMREQVQRKEKEAGCQ